MKLTKAPNLLEEGFTLIETLVTIAIIGILASLSVLAYSRRPIQKAQEVEVYLQAMSIRDDIISHYWDYGQFPDDQINNVKPYGNIYWRDKSEFVYNSPLDYEHRSLGNGMCFVGVTYFGPNGVRDSSTWSYIPQGDDMVFDIIFYQCNLPRGPIRGNDPI